MGNAVPKLGDVFGKKSAVIAFEDALNDSFRQQQLLASEVEKLNQKVAMLQEQTSQYEAYGREQQTAADDARRELRRLKDFVAEQQALGSFVTDPDTDEALVSVFFFFRTSPRVICCLLLGGNFCTLSHTPASLSWSN